MPFGSICIVALLDGSQGDPPGQVDTLKQVAQINPLGPVSYAWVDVSSAPGFASQLGLSLSNAPTVVLLNAKKMRYARLEGVFNVRTLTAFADGVVSGKIGVSKLEVSGFLWSLNTKSGRQTSKATFNVVGFSIFTASLL